MATDGLRPAVRLQHYIRGIAALANGEFVVSGASEGIVVRADMSIGDVMDAMSTYPYGKVRLDRWAQRADATVTKYVTPLIEAAREAGVEAPLLVIPGDNTVSPLVPALAKSRPWPQTGAGVTARVNVDRHWAGVDEVAASDRPFEEKERRLVWRGSTTGRFGARRRGEAYGSRFHVMHAMRRTKDERIDLGYSSIVQLGEGSSDRPVARVKRYVRPALSISEQLQARYLLSLEGNDVASGLKWMLASNSVVLMPAPRMESWACEGLLRPFEHYVPVLPDLSNLEEVFTWCLENDDACRAITERGRAFVAGFLDEETERGLLQQVIEEYARRVTLKAAPGSPLAAFLPVTG